MAGKADGSNPLRRPGLALARAPESGRPERIRADLERRGVPAELASLLSARIAPLVVAVGGEAYEAALTAAAAAWTLSRDDGGARRGEQDLDELQRLMGAFTGELKKLDEALQILTTYVTRMRERSTSDERLRTLH